MRECDTAHSGTLMRPKMKSASLSKKKEGSEEGVVHGIGGTGGPSIFYERAVHTRGGNNHYNLTGDLEHLWSGE